MRLERHKPEWYERLATLQTGYYYPWRSTIATWYGEDMYRELVRRHLRPEMDVLDVACGHGEMALEIAPQVRSVLAYDRTAAWINLGQDAANRRGILNVSFICYDSSLAANQGGPIFRRRPAPSICWSAARGHFTGSRMPGAWRALELSC
ncbi:MAG: class I SAM-dependent methyltransferase [Chloroflexi bacterium]|nr:class I SAM-dependent methyltransferase [Chloroflexota bacterium]